MYLVRDGEGRDAAVASAQLPLGPWAGAAVQAWATKTGHVWHADPDCSAIRTRAKEAVHPQPESGGLDQLALPDGWHCDPPGDLATYRRRADELLRRESKLRTSELAYELKRTVVAQ